MGKTPMCDECRARYDRYANTGSGVLADPWAAVWRAEHEACGCVGENIHFDGMRIRMGGRR
jgi:hypothetical protein